MLRHCGNISGMETVGRRGTGFPESAAFWCLSKPVPSNRNHSTNVNFLAWYSIEGPHRAWWTLRILPDVIRFHRCRRRGFASFYPERSLFPRKPSTDPLRNIPFVSRERLRIPANGRHGDGRRRNKEAKCSSKSDRSIEREVYSSGLWPSSLAVEERNGAALSAWAVGSPVLTRHISYLNPPTRCISLGPVRFLRRGKISNGPLVYAAATYEFSYLAEITFG